MIREVTASFTRPANTTAYADGDLVANSATAASVVPMVFHLGSGGGVITSIFIQKSDGTDVANADFTLNLYGASPTPANGDNGEVSTDVAQFIGVVDCDAMSAGTDDAYLRKNIGQANFPAGLYTAKMTIYGLLEANAAYTPASEEVFTVTLTYVSGGVV